MMTDATETEDDLDAEVTPDPDDAMDMDSQLPGLHDDRRDEPELDTALAKEPVEIKLAPALHVIVFDDYTHMPGRRTRLVSNTTAFDEQTTNALDEDVWMRGGDIGHVTAFLVDELARRIVVGNLPVGLLDLTARVPKKRGPKPKKTKARKLRPAIIVGEWVIDEDLRNTRVIVQPDGNVGVDIEDTNAADERVWVPLPEGFMRPHASCHRIELAARAWAHIFPEGAIDLRSSPY